MKFVVLIVLFLFVQASISNASDAETTKEIWSLLMIKVTPEKFCSSGMYFSSCFKLSNKDCKYLIETSTRQCLVKFDSELPKILTRTSGAYWGGVIGHCTGSTFDTALTKEGMKINNLKCSDINNWSWK